MYMVGDSRQNKLLNFFYDKKFSYYCSLPFLPSRQLHLSADEYRSILIHLPSPSLHIYVGDR